MDNQDLQALQATWYKKLKDEGKITHSIRWGGNWSGSPEIKPEKFFDGAHIEVIL